MPSSEYQKFVRANTFLSVDGLEAAKPRFVKIVTEGLN